MSSGGLNIEKMPDNASKTSFVDQESPRITHNEHHSNASTESPQPTPTAPYREHGPLIDRSMTAENFSKNAFNSGLAWPRVRHFLREPLSEFMGTFILIMFGDGVVAQKILSDGQGGDYQSISWGWVSVMAELRKCIG